MKIVSWRATNFENNSESLAYMYEKPYTEVCETEKHLSKYSLKNYLLSRKKI